MVRWPINAHPIIVMAAIAISLDYISIGIDSLITIGLDCISIGVDGGFDGGLMVGSMVGYSIHSTWPCWTVDLSKVFDSSDERFLWLSAKRVLRAIIIVF